MSWTYKDPLLLALGQTLRDKRNSLGLSIRDAARISSVPRSTIQDLENAEYNTRFLTIAALAKAYNLTLPQLFEKTQTRLDAIAQNRDLASESGEN